MYLELNPIKTSANDEPGVLIGMPGLSLMQTVGTGPIRALYTSSDLDTVYIVTGNKIYRLTGTTLSTSDLVGTMLTSTGPVSIQDNGFQTVFVDGQFGYYTSINTSAQTTFGELLSGGADYNNGTYINYPVAGGVGAGLTADIIIQDNVVISIIVHNPGVGYQVGDLFNIDSLGGTGFQISAASVPLTLTQITSPNFYPASSIAFQDGYFIFNQIGTPNFFISDLYSANLLPLNAANKSGSPDNIQTIININRILYLVGQSTIETWWDSGASGSTPFARQDGQYNQVGCIAAQTVKRLFNSFMWLGQSPEGGGVVYQMINSQAIRVSNHALEYQIQHLNSTVDISSSSAYSWQVEGHYFYVLNLTGSDTTWVYDLSTGQWTEQQSILNGVIHRHIGSTHAYYNGMHLIGDFQNGNLYKYDYDTYTDNGQPIIRIRQAPHIVNNMNNIFYKLFEIMYTPGLGASTGTINEVTPKVTLQISDDGGKNWSHPIFATIGKQGEFTHRARWARLGYSRDRIFRVTCSDPVKFDIVSCMLDAETGYA